MPLAGDPADAIPRRMIRRSIVLPDLPHWRHYGWAHPWDPDTRAFFLSLMREVVAVGRAKGVSIPEDFADDRMRFGEASPPTFKASMLHDLERGNRLELEWLAGKVVEFGRALGVPTPANQAVYAILKLHRMGEHASKKEPPAAD